MAEVAIIGAGAWGTALAVLLARNAHATVLCARRPEQLHAMRAARENLAHLPGIELPAELELTADWIGAVGNASTVVMAVPSSHARAAITPIAHAIPRSATIVSVTKGIEQDSLCTMTQMLAELAPPAGRIAVLSGPGFAAEVGRGKPAAIVAAARQHKVAARVQNLFAVKTLRVYRSSDVIGVELGGAAKNVIAIAAGVNDGLELGSSARAALITRGLAEMMRLATAAGARRETMAGLAGLGDLVLTCTGDSSRNRSLGLRIGRGEPMPLPVPDAPIAEGFANANSVRKLAERLKVEMPIVFAVYRLLYEAAPANAMVEELLSRELKTEF
ncbi:MAG TPA: NAD(P)H-dependent glycerol-3-phosphate dehydrogenase [Candidatus Binataceae bacterium]|nr:NAD(P)H-dependent glycerol-3-phosphate dehydrogenase [Candidatus Binataceae bacterium]